MGRPPGKPKKGEQYRLHMLLPGELVAEVDAIAATLTKDDPYGRTITRTDTLRMLVAEAVKARRGR